ncbi:hypothetical protein V1634_29170 [Plantactinospora veratri]|uniref:Uncharacterized protein n=1 Tax=Plantactinospora veratri TaxID=1436122 RepID=A0ABU7SMI3_9ACTN
MNAVAVWALSLAGAGLALVVALVALISRYLVCHHGDRFADDVAHLSATRRASARH